jgi:ACR3 family arsenite efflux pump ArsB
MLIPPLRFIEEIFILIFYVGPVALFISEGTAVKKEPSDFILFVVPMLAWSVLLGLGACLVSFLAQRRRDEGGIQK